MIRLRNERKSLFIILDEITLVGAAFRRRQIQSSQQLASPFLSLGTSLKHSVIPAATSRLVVDHWVRFLCHDVPGP